MQSQARELGAHTTQHLVPQDHTHTIEPSSEKSVGNQQECPSDSSEAFPASKDDFEYPEGGLQAWLVVFGSWCALVCALGIANTMGSFQAYIAKHQLKDYSEGTIGWIFSLYTFLAFFCGIYIGPVFDKYGPRWLIAAGSALTIASMMLFSICTAYWHFILAFGLAGGLGTSLVFTPAIAVVGHWFSRRRGSATGIAATGGAIGGIVFPLMLQSLIPKIGWGWSIRIIGFIFVALCVVANVLIRSRLPPAENAKANPDFRIFRDPAFAVTVLGVFLVEFALFIPLTYISSYAQAVGFDEAFSYQILPILNVGSVFGRWLPGLFADKFGRYNCSILAILLTIVSVLAIWLPAGDNKAALIIFALLFGFASGSNISLTPVAIGQLCPTDQYGRYYATCYTVVSIGCLLGVPIAGEVLAADNGDYWGLIVLVGCCYFGGLMAFLFVRIRASGWRLKAKY